MSKDAAAKKKYDNTALFELPWAAYKCLNWTVTDPETGKTYLDPAVVPSVFEAGGEKYVKLARSDIKPGSVVLPICNRGKMMTVLFLDGDKNAVQFNDTGKDKHLSMTWLLDDPEVIDVVRRLQDAHVLGVLAMRDAITGLEKKYWEVDDFWGRDDVVERAVRTAFCVDNPVSKNLPTTMSKDEKAALRKLDRRLPIRGPTEDEYPGKINLKISPNFVDLPKPGTSETDADVKDGVFLEFNAAMEARNVSLHRKDIVMYSRGFFKWGLVGAGRKSAMWRVFSGIVDVDVQKHKNDAESIQDDERAEMLQLNAASKTSTTKRKADEAFGKISGYSIDPEGEAAAYAMELEELKRAQIGLATEEPHI